MAWVKDKQKDFGVFMSRLYHASPVGKIVRAITYQLLKGRYEFHTSFDDLRSPATAINLPGQPADPAVDTDGSLLFSATIENNIAIIVQIPHSWKIGSQVYPHLHWCKSVIGAGGVDWQMRYRTIRNGGSTTSWSDYASAQSVFPVTSGTENNIAKFPAIDTSEMRLSDLLSFQVRRMPSSASDDYPSAARFWEFDVHYEMDSDGSFYEYQKDE